MMVKEYSNSSMIYADEIGGTGQLIHHLLELGHRHFLQIDGDGTNYERRLAAMRHILHDAGLDPTTHLHLIKCPTNWIDPQLLLPDVNANNSPSPADLSMPVISCTI